MPFLSSYTYKGLRLFGAGAPASKFVFTRRGLLEIYLSQPIQATAIFQDLCWFFV